MLNALADDCIEIGEHLLIVGQRAPFSEDRYTVPVQLDDTRYLLRVNEERRFGALVIVPRPKRGQLARFAIDAPRHWPIKLNKGPRWGDRASRGAA